MQGSQNVQYLLLISIFERVPTQSSLSYALFETESISELAISEQILQNWQLLAITELLTHYFLV